MIRAGIRAWCGCSRACRAPARAAAAVRCRGSIGAPPISPRASPRTAADHSPASAMRHSSRSCRMRCCGSAKRPRWTSPTSSARPDGSGTVTVTGSKTDQEGRGHVRYLGAPTMQRLSAWLSGAGIVNGGPLFRQVLKDGATVTAAPRRPVNPGDHRQARTGRCWHCRARVRALAPGRLRAVARSSRRRAGRIARSGRLAGAHHAGALYARHQFAARGAVAKLRYQARAGSSAAARRRYKVGQ